MLFLLSDVYTRICDLQDSSKVFGADYLLSSLIIYYDQVYLPADVNK